MPKIYSSGYIDCFGVSVFVYKAGYMLRGRQKRNTFGGGNGRAVPVSVYDVASFLLRSGLGEAAGKPFDKVCEKLFRLPGVLAPVIIMSQIGGFPIGAKMTYELLKKKCYNRKRGAKSLSFFA